MSHGFRTPLTVVKEYASLVREVNAEELSPLQKRFLDVIAVRTDDMEALVSDLLDAGRIATDSLGLWRWSTPARELVRDVEQSLQRRAEVRNLALRVTADSDALVFCEAERARRVLGQLVGLALELTKDDFPVHLSLRDEPDADDIILAVSYTGEPLEKRQEEQMFGGRAFPISRSSAESASLANYVSAELVRQNLGYWRYEYANQRGRFELAVPRNLPRVIIPRFLRLMREKPHLPQSVAVLEIRTACETSQSEHEFTSLLRFPLRGFDLLLAGEPNQWFVLVPGIRDDAESTAEQIDSTRQDMNSIRVHSPLPEFTARVLGDWALTDISGVLDVIVPRCAQLTAVN